MVDARTFFGLSMERQGDRRLLVVGYCTFLAGFIALGFFWNQGFLFGGLLQTILLAGLLGGIRGGGPVKSFSGREHVPGDPSSTTQTFPVQTLNLEHRLPTGHERVRLDERETTERDHAHFTAFRLLRWIACPLCLLLAVALYDIPQLVLRYAPGILWAVIMLILTLPQLVILWTEPDAIE